ncbi:hypothetical protein NMY22_g17358 [Coprinellus aureogranulatus]|nr:hypothetical protein NMY22_g17358 [Coprinellus aureogranulatus]
MRCPKEIAGETIGLATVRKREDQIIDRLTSKGRPVTGSWPKVLVIDGLDECDAEPGLRFGQKTETHQDRRLYREEVQCEILSTLHKASLDPAFPFRILLASRPEQAIRNFFSSLPLHHLRLYPRVDQTTPILSPILSMGRGHIHAIRSFKEIFLDDKYNPEGDIEKFAWASLTKIGRDRGLPESWFGRGVPKMIAQQASGQFVYATTALRFLKDHSRPPHEQLERVLEWRRFDDSEPFAALDALYTGILETSPIPTIAAKWLCAIDAMKDKVGKGFRQSLLESFSGETQYVLGTLPSLIDLATFNFYHQSVIDFLKDPRRSGDLHISDADADRFIGERYYQVLKNRGPQSTTDDINYFLRLYCGFSPHLFDLGRQYEEGDVEWWIASFSGGLNDDYSVNSLPLIMLAAMHQECRWYRCLASCAVWRRAMLNYGQSHPADARKWDIPTTAYEIFRYDLKNLRKHQYMELSSRSYKSDSSRGVLSQPAKALGLFLLLLLSSYAAVVYIS